MADIEQQQQQQEATPSTTAASASAPAPAPAAAPPTGDPTSPTSPTTSVVNSLWSAYGEAMTFDGDGQPTPLNHYNYLNVASYVLNVLVTFGIGTGGWFGFMTNAEISALFQTLITPAGWAFSIWSVIFLAQAIFTGIQLLPLYRSKPQVQDGVKYFYASTCLFQIVWTIIFSYQKMWLAFFAMIGILCSLMALVDSQCQAESEKTWREYWLFRFPFQIHLGWIIPATLLNFSVALVAMDYSHSGQVFAAVASLLILLGVSLFVLFVPAKPKFVIPVVCGWAVGGIWSELSNPSQRIKVLFEDSTIFQLSIASAVVCVLIFVAVAGRAVQYHLRKEGGSKEGGETKSSAVGAANGDYVNVDKISEGAYA